MDGATRLSEAAAVRTFVEFQYAYINSILLYMFYTETWLQKAPH